MQKIMFTLFENRDKDIDLEVKEVKTKNLIIMKKPRIRIGRKMSIRNYWFEDVEELILSRDSFNSHK